MAPRNVSVFSLFKHLLLVGSLLTAGAETQAGQDPEKVVLQEIRAIVTHIVGEAFAKPPSGPRISVQRFLVLRGDTWLELKPGTRLTVACVSGAILKIEESGLLGAEQCLLGTGEPGSSRGAAQAAARAASALAYRGRVTLWRNSPVLEGETRFGEGFGGIRPVLLSPRCPNEMSARLECSRLVAPPREIRWTGVEGASDYVVTLGGFDDLRVDAADCRDDPRLEQPVCSRPWPEGWRVKPGKKYFLRVAAQVDLFEKAESEKTKIELLSKDEAAEVQARVEAIDALDLDVETRGLMLTSSLYAERQLFNAAVEILEEVTRETSDPLLHLALGDAYMKVGLLHSALRRYNSVLQRLAASASRREIQAAAEFGLGWVHYLDDRPRPALVHFRNSKNLSVEEQLIHQAVLMIEKLEKLQNVK